MLQDRIIQIIAKEKLQKERHNSCAIFISAKMDLTWYYIYVFYINDNLTSSFTEQVYLSTRNFNKTIYRFLVRIADNRKIISIRYGKDRNYTRARKFKWRQKGKK